MMRKKTEDPICSFKLSKLAEEKGYLPKNLFMANYYNWKGEFWGDSTDSIKEFISKKKSGETGPLKYQNTYAPSLSNLQTWLREKNNIIVWVDILLITESENKGIRYTWLICDLTGNILAEDESPLGFLKWHESLEVGLETGLNFVNTNKNTKS